MDSTEKNLRYLIPITLTVILLNVYLVKLGYEMTGYAVAGQCLSSATISKTPDNATLHDFKDVTGKVNVSDDEYALQSVLVSPKFIYLNWTNNISGNIQEVALTLEHQEHKLNISLQWWNKTDWMKVCDIPEASSDTLDYCYLSNYINTPEKANQIALRLNLTSIDNSHEKLDWALLNITYCKVYDSDTDNISDEEDNCPYNFNPEQEDIDNDNIGDICDEIWGYGPDIDTNIPNLIVNETKIESTYIVISSNNSTVVEFLWNQSFPLILSNVSIYKQEESDSRGALMVSGINLSGSNETKTVYIDKILDKGYVCILDKENATISNISTYCTGTEEVKIDCPGIKDSYNCSITLDNRYKIEGLINSALQETENIPKASDRGGSKSTCRPNWQCYEWGNCQLDGYKYRECIDLNKCNVMDGMPELSTKCTAAELCFNGIRDIGEEGIDCGGACEPCPVEEEKEENKSEITEVVVEKPVQIKESCEPIPWLYWVLYILVIGLSYYTTKYLGKQERKNNRRKLISNILIACNLLLVIVIILDLSCRFRWHISLLVFPPLIAVYFLLNILLKKIKKK